MVYTIGHSTHKTEDFLAILQSFEIETLIDVRRFPGSRKFPQYNKDILEATLQRKGISYLHIPELGGRRKPHTDSKNTAWRNASFRGYADYMETGDFANGIATLQATALKSRTVYMCSEALWWRCHRAMISDYLKAKEWSVFHIMGINKIEEHRYTAPATVKDTQLLYTGQKTNE